MKSSFIRFSMFLTAVFLLSSFAFAGDKYEFCGNNHSYSYNGKRQIVKKDLREMTIPATSLLEVDSKLNGGIKVVGENRSDILVRACVRAWDETEEDAIAVLNNTRIQTSGVIRAENDTNKKRFSASYQILVPNQTDLNLKAFNGGISIRNVDGTLKFKTLNGSVKLMNVAGDIKGRTTNGSVKVNLVGNSFRGEGIDVTTTNGSVKLNLPKNFAANIETGTVNGGFKSDFAELRVKKDDKRRWHVPKRVNASLNGGGAPIRVTTTNGGVKISSIE